MKRIYFFLLLCFTAGSVFAQTPQNKELDSLRKMEEVEDDSVVITAKYIRYTTPQVLLNSTRTFQIDTNTRNFQHYNPLFQPYRPTVSLGNIGLAATDLLFNPTKRIGFDVGFHSLDIYRLTNDSVRFYRSRSPYTDLYYVNGSLREQVFRVIHTQNIKPNWNFGVNYNRIGSDGLYKNQNVSHLNAAIFSWYESRNHRYNVLGNLLFNTLKAGENAGLPADTVFTQANPVRRDAETVRLSGIGANRPNQTWREKG